MYGHNTNGSATPLAIAGTTTATLPYTGLAIAHYILAAVVLLFAGVAMITVGKIMTGRRPTAQGRGRLQTSADVSGPTVA